MTDASFEGGTLGTLVGLREGIILGIKNGFIVGSLDGDRFSAVVGLFDAVV